MSTQKMTPPQSTTFTYTSPALKSSEQVAHALRALIDPAPDFQPYELVLLRAHVHFEDRSYTLLILSRIALFLIQLIS
jgi:hypothetical protein